MNVDQEKVKRMIGMEDKRREGTNMNQVVMGKQEDTMVVVYIIPVCTIETKQKKQSKMIIIRDKPESIVPTTKQIGT